MKGSSFDLNHARALHHLLEEAHVTRAAKKLGITPAAASNALHRLRVDFGDPLLVRSGRTLTRTLRAEELRAPATDVMRAAERLFERERPFDPATASWEIRFTVSDRIADLLLPTFDEFLSERAPGARLTVRTNTVDIGAFLRDHGGIAILPEAMKDANLRSEPLFVDDHLCVVRKGHPISKRRWSLERFCALDHVLVAPQSISPRSAVDALLSKQGLSRRVTRVVSSFALALPLVAGSDRVTILPRTLAEASALRFPLEFRPIPVVMPDVQMCMAWSLGHDGDPRHAWTRQLLHEVVRAMKST